MRAKAGIFILICLLFLVGGVGAVGIPDKVTVTTDKPLMVANGVDQSTITVFVTNTTPGYSGVVRGVKIILTVDPSYGTLNSPTASSTTLTTNLYGKASAIFNTSTKSGEPIIQATLPGYPAVSGEVIQNIHHDSISLVVSPDNGVVGEQKSFIISLPETDLHGNLVNDWSSDDTVSLSVSCPMPNDCEFVTPAGDSLGHFFSSHPGLDTNLEIHLRLGTKTGLTTVVMGPAHDFKKQQVIIIDTKPGDQTLASQIFANGEPVPELPIPTVPAATGVFSFVYTLSDQFDNPVKNQPILVATDQGETQLTYTNVFGQTPVLKFGPKDTISTIKITANVVDPITGDPLVDPITGNLIAEPDEFKVSFTAPLPQDMIISPPQSVESLDELAAGEYQYADIVVQVHDDYGAPINGELITFTLGEPSYSPDSVPSTIDVPHLMAMDGRTGPDGKLTIQFKPGRFDTKGPSEGSCQVTATYDNITLANPIIKSTTVTWTNRPYLTINTDVTPEFIKQGDNVDVTITISLNGNPHYRPVSLMLDHDTSGSMSSPDNTADGGGRRRLKIATDAATGFINGLVADDIEMQMGLETFPDHGNVAIGSTDAVITKLTQLGQTKPVQNSLDMGPSIVTSMDKLIAATQTAGHEGDVKVLILLSDGGSQLNNDPVFLQGLIDKAKANNVMIFPIAYMNNAAGGTCSACVIFQNLADQTGGIYNEVSTATELVDIYDLIAEEIKIRVEDDTTMDLVFEDILIDSKPYNGPQLYQYIPQGPFVDRTTDPSQVNLGGRTSIIWPDKNQTVVDQTTQWESNTLHFTVGNINLGETWEAKFTLKANKAGCYNLFGPDSAIYLNDVPLLLDDVPICVSPPPTNVGFDPATLIVSFQGPPERIGADFVKLTWYTEYDSQTSTNEATETFSYKVEGTSIWKVFYVTQVGDEDNLPKETILDVRDIPQDKTIFIRVDATANDAVSTFDETSVPPLNSADKYIYLS